MKESPGALHFCAHDVVLMLCSWCSWVVNAVSSSIKQSHRVQASSSCSWCLLGGPNCSCTAKCARGRVGIYTVCNCTAGVLAAAHVYIVYCNRWGHQAERQQARRDARHARHDASLQCSVLMLDQFVRALLLHGVRQMLYTCQPHFAHRHAVCIACKRSARS